MVVTVIGVWRAVGFMAKFISFYCTLFIVCMYGSCACKQANAPHTTHCVDRSEDNTEESVLSLHQASSRDRTQVIRLGSERLYLLTDHHAPLAIVRVVEEVTVVEVPCSSLKSETDLGGLQRPV